MTGVRCSPSRVATGTALPASSLPEPTSGPTIEPDPQTIRECVEALGGGLDGYAMDVGVLDSGETAVVEVNEGFAIGTYGLPAHATAEVLIARWKQLTAETVIARP